MDYDQNRKWLNGDELIGRRIVPGLKVKHDQFVFEERELVNAGVDVAYLLTRLGPGWSEREGPREREVSLVRNISVEQAISQIHQHIGLRTPLSGTPI